MISQRAENVQMEKEINGLKEVIQELEKKTDNNNLHSVDQT